MLHATPVVSNSSRRCWQREERWERKWIKLLWFVIYFIFLIFFLLKSNLLNWHTKYLCLFVFDMLSLRDIKKKLKNHMWQRAKSTTTLSSLKPIRLTTNVVSVILSSHRVVSQSTSRIMSALLHSFKILSFSWHGLRHLPWYTF